MGVLGAVARTAQAYPSLLLPVILLSIAVSIRAYRRRRWVPASALLCVAGLSALLYAGAPRAEALSRLAPTGTAAPATTTASAAATRSPFSGANGELASFSSSTHLHPRFPEDLPLPAVFHVEHSFGGLRTGTVTIRFRFRGEGADAVRQLRDLGTKSGWQVESTAPHRLALRKGERQVDAWFSFPAHSVVLDFNDLR
ncbi:MAG TPA: hypothetical protein VFT43_14195 [Candidatus Polarisedimenticolia bacterium]|nr:hypothetical protein [Candidatus Polarisedimenticolia bacterium]